MLDILKELDNKKQEFHKIEQNIMNLQDELKRLQGEYRLLVKMGINDGILDEKGQIIEKE